MRFTGDLKSMKKFLKAALLSVCLVCFALGAAACTQRESESKEPGFHYYTTQSGEKVLYEYVAEKDDAGNDVTKVVIPDDLGISKIQAGAFGGNGTIEELVISSTVKEIAAGAFEGMQKLKSITLPFVGEKAGAVDEKKTFGYVFGTEEYDAGVAVPQSYGSSSATYYLPKTLESVTVVGGEDYALPDYAFHSMSNLKSVTLGGVSAIGDYAFYGCYYLTNFSVPASVESIGAQAFVDCDRLNGTAAVGADVSVKGNFAFAAESKLASIGDHAFAGTNLKEIDLSGLEDLAEIGIGAFAGSIVPDESDGTVTEFGGRLEKVVLPASVTKIPSRAFYNCDNLVTVIYSDDLTEICGDAFAGCDKLRVVKNASYAAADPTDAKEGVVVIPAGVTKVWAGAFVNIGADKITYTLVNDAAAGADALTEGWRNSDGKWNDPAEQA